MNGAMFWEILGDNLLQPGGDMAQEVRAVVW